jgi:two-component system, OmpR family, response regulator TrcR
MQIALDRRGAQFMAVKERTVLVVDDDEGLAEIVALTLSAAGFEAYTANDGIEGYARYRCYPTDWVVTDIQMPRLDGFEMIHRIRVINPCVKVLYMSGNVDQFYALLQRETAQNGVKVLRKPFVRIELINLLTGRSNRPAPVRSIFQTK